MNPAAGQLEEKQTSELTKANAVIDELMETSPEVIRLMEQSLKNITKCERSLCQYQLREKFQTALLQGGISTGIVCRLAKLMAYNTVRDVGCGARNGALFFIFTYYIYVKQLVLSEGI